MNGNHLKPFMVSIHVTHFNLILILILILSILIRWSKPKQV
jgi:hypothetical protein